MESENKEYRIDKGEFVYKRPKQPRPEDYYDILETEEERAERIYLYSEVKEDE